MRRLILTVLLCFVGTLSQRSFAERPSTGNPLDFIAQNAPLSFDPSGAVYFPAAVYQAIQQKRMSNLMKFLLMNNTLSQCVEAAVKRSPERQDSYQTAAKKFEEGLCQIQNCFMTALILDMAQDSGGGPQIGMALASAAGKNDCSKDSKGQSIDPMMLMMLQKQQGK